LNTEMFRAIRSGDVDEVMRLLDTDPTLLEKQGIGRENLPRENMTPVILASSVGKLDMVKLLVERGANIHATASDSGGTALHYAAEEGHKEVVVYLLDNGADPMHLDQSGWTPLIGACVRGDLRLVLLLLEHVGGQGLETRDICGHTVLQLAVFGRQEEVAAELLRHGARAGTVDNCGISTLRTAVGSGHVGVMKLLVGTLGTPALDERDDKGKSLMHHAAYSAKDEMMAYLLGKGLRPSITDNDGMTPLMDGAKRSGSETLRVLEMLLSHMHTHEVDMRDALEGYTALHWAVQEDHPSNVKVLLLGGADASIVDNEGRTPRMRAGEGQRPECVTVFEVGSHIGFSIMSRDILH
jgi:ankyrin repeat protein